MYESGSRAHISSNSNENPANGRTFPLVYSIGCKNTLIDMNK